MIGATQLRVGMIILFDKELYKVIEVMHYVHSKSRGIVQTKLRNLKTGVTIENRFRSDDKIEKANLEQKDMEYLYNNDSEYIFMDKETYEQFPINSDILRDSISYLIPNTVIKINLFEGKPVGIELPLTVSLKVISTEPYLKGATASTSSKPATLETGLVVHVPQFIENGDIIKVDTTEGKYLERVK
jgi:elongation factor P